MPRTARVAWVAVVIGLVTFSALMAFDFFLLALEQTLPDAQAQAVDEAFQQLTWTVAGLAVARPGGWALALLLTPIAAARARVISWWTAGAALAGPPAVPGVRDLAAAVVPDRAGDHGRGVRGGRMAAGPRRPGRRRRSGQLRGLPPRAGRICLIAAPLLFAAGMATVTADTVAHPVRTQVSAFLLHLGWVLFVPAVLHVAARAGRFTQVAAGVTVLALINFSALMMGDSADLAARQVLDAATADRVGDTFGGLPLFAFGWMLPGMVLSLLGLVVVPIGAAVDRAGQPLGGRARGGRRRGVPGARAGLGRCRRAAAAAGGVRPDGA